MMKELVVATMVRGVEESDLLPMLGIRTTLHR